MCVCVYVYMYIYIYNSQDFIKDNFAYGDHGQNYKNIITLVKSLNLEFEEGSEVIEGLGYAGVPSDFGCPKAADTRV